MLIEPRRVAHGCSVALVAGAVAVAAATPAHAAAIGSPSWNGTTLLGGTLAGAVSDTFTFSNTSGSTVYLINDTGSASVGASSCASTGIATSNCAVINNATVTVTVTSLGTIGVWSGVLRSGNITVSAGSSPPSGDRSSTDSGGPAAVLQQFARPESGTCDAAQPTGLDWAGVAAGGWTDSWAEWMNDGRGGAVCTRTLSYSVASGAWIVE